MYASASCSTIFGLLNDLKIKLSDFWKSFYRNRSFFRNFELNKSMQFLRPTELIEVFFRHFWYLWFQYKIQLTLNDISQDSRRRKVKPNWGKGIYLLYVFVYIPILPAFQQYYKRHSCESKFLRKCKKNCTV